MFSSDVAENLRRLAVEAGFDYAAIGPVDVAQSGETLKAWLARGDHAEMSYMERGIEKRLDPRNLVPAARSALCVALRYHPLQDEVPVAGDLWPNVARYARGEDYHHLMQERLNRLAERIEETYPGLPLRGYVDTGPILERELAARAGLGAIGKNTNLLLPEGGSWILLGELFLSCGFDPDPPIADLCGSCTMCLDACPTGALPEAYRLDSRRCISYWTIEHRGPIPIDTRSKLGPWVFGCDICQEVCPLNEDPAPVDHKALRLPAERSTLDLVGLLLIGRNRYVETFRRSPLKRAKQSGLRRNAAIAMGNSGDAGYLAALETALRSDDVVVRSHSAWAIGRIGGDRASQILADRLSAEEDDSVLSELRQALAECEVRSGKTLENT